MSTHVFKSLRPSAGAMKALYTVPSGMRFTGRIIITNCNASVSLVYVKVAPAGASDASVHAIIDDMPIGGNEAISTAPLMLSEGDIIRVISLNGETNFHVTGLLQDL